MDEKRTAWERLQLIHTKGRPTIKDYIPQIFTDWYEMHGDRLFGDDRAIIGGLARLDDTVTVETRFDPQIARALQRRGHRIRVDLNTPSFGRGQMIVRLSNGVLVGGTESRTDSNIACF